jgi:hypothetical protein
MPWKAKKRTTYSTGYSQQLSASTYGLSIPISRGTRLVEGQVLWGTGIKQETKSTTTHYEYQLTFDERIAGERNPDDPPQPDPTTTVETTRLYLDIAIGFGRPLNPDIDAKILQLRAGNTIIYDTTSKATAALKATGYTVYTGSETQMPDPTMEGYLGKGNVPAYRGEIYIVFQELDLLQFGGELPTITALIADHADIANPIEEMGGSAFYETYSVDTIRGLLYAQNKDLDLSIRIFDLRQFFEVGQLTVNTPAGLGALGSPMDCAEWFNVLIVASGGGNSNPIHCVDAETGALKSTFGFLSAGLSFGPLNFALQNNYIAQIVNNGTSDASVYVIATGQLGGVGMLQLSSSGVLTYAGHDNDMPAMQIGCRGSVSTHGSYVFTVRNTSIWRFDLTSSLSRRAPDGLGNLTLPNSKLSSAAWLDIGADYSFIASVKWYDDEQVLLVFAELVTPVNGKNGAFLKIDINGRIIFKSYVTDAGGRTTARCRSIISDGNLGWLNATALQTINIKTGVETAQGATTPKNFAGFIWVGFGGCVVGDNNAGGTARVITPLGIGGRVSFATLLSELAVFCGLDEADIIVDPAITDQVDGLNITNGADTDFWTMTKTWGEFFLFEVIESGDGIQFKRNVKVGDDDTVDFELTEDDIAMLQQVDFPVDTGDPFSNAAIITTRKDSTDIVDFVEVTYSDFDFDFHLNKYYITRARLPTDLRRDGKRLIIDIPELTFRSNEASSLAANVLFNEMSSRLLHTFRLPQKYANALPGDIFQITIEEFQYKIKLASVTWHNDFTSSCQGTDYWSDVALVVNDNQLPDPPPNEPVPDNTSQIIVFDMPTLAYWEEPGSGNIAVYYGVSGMGQDGWRHAGVYHSFNGGKYDAFDDVDHELWQGRCITLLDAVTDPFSIDNASSFDFVLQTGLVDAFGSVGDAGLLSQAMVAVVGAPGRWELIAIRDIVAIDDAPPTFTCSGFIRGLRDTYMNANTHQAGDKIIFPFMNGARRFAFEDLSVRGTTVYYKAVGDDQEQFTAPRVALIPQEAQRPWSVVNQRAVKNSGDNDIVLTWNRQSRLAVPLLSIGVEDYVNEFRTENYTVDIYDGPGGTLKRTIIDLASPTYTYSAANQATDGFTAPLSDLTYKVTQVDIDTSALGRTLERTVIVERS